MLELRTQHHETRLSNESWYLARRLKRLVAAAGGDAGARDYRALELNDKPEFRISGLVTLRVTFGWMKATLLSAPGEYFYQDKPEGLALLEALATARRANGRRVVIVTKHQIIGRERCDLGAMIRNARRDGGAPGGSAPIVPAEIAGPAPDALPRQPLGPVLDPAPVFEGDLDAVFAPAVLAARSAAITAGALGTI